MLSVGLMGLNRFGMVGLGILNPPEGLLDQVGWWIGRLPYVQNT